MTKINLAVVAVSLKKEQGWIKGQTLGGKSWSDVGMKFDKVKFKDTFATAGIFEIEYSSQTSIETGYTAYFVENATLIKSFADILKG